LGFGALSMVDVLRHRAAANDSARHKSVIMIVLPGGPSHIDLHDLKPDAPVEIRGEFQPIATNVPGTFISELLPRQAQIADKLTIVRSFQVAADLQHALHEVYTGFSGEPNQAFPGGRAIRPAFGSVVSHFARKRGPLPAYVSLREEVTSRAVPVAEDVAYLSPAHRPFVPTGNGMQNFTPLQALASDRLTERRSLVLAFDDLRRNVDWQAEASAMDRYSAQALDLVTSPRVRDAFDVTLEPSRVRDAYGPVVTVKSATESKMVPWNPLAFLQARRLVEAGVSVVTVAAGDWDHHSATGAPNIFDGLRSLVPAYDQAIAALITDLHERGLERDVLVVVWGEFGRTPKISERGGRDHWPPAGCVLFAGGGLKMGQTVGATDRNAAQPTTRPIGPQNVLATLYRHLGINPAATIPDHRGRPMYLLDEQEPVAELF
jgi:hypothetical protein